MARQQTTGRPTKGQPTQKTMYRVSTPKTYEQNGEEKVFWQNIGRGFHGAKGISIELNALPMNGRMFLFEDTGDQEQVPF